MAPLSPVLTPHISPISIFIPPPTSNPTHSKPLYHIFFIPGNPGLISYYHTFLFLLSSHLAPLNPAAVHVYGHSAANFTDALGEEPLGLRGQIEYFLQLLKVYVGAVREGGERRDGKREVKVILVGHSVGAYIALEMLRRIQETRKGDGEGIRVVGVVGLWPTVTHIARSASGVRMGWLLKLPHFAIAVGMLAHALTFFVPETALSRLLKLVMGFPNDAATTTARFLKNSMGVRQALHMAKDEMNEITEDQWDEDIWGAVTESADQRPKLIFYFGKRDHWVADHTRDELIAARAYQDGGEEWKPRMLIDEEGIPHSFPIKHGGPVARIVAGFVDEIIRADKP